jgi:5-methylcytosine-specific restriction endonuclease McrA
MPIKTLKKFFTGPAPRIARDEAMKVFKRDHFQCQYCGLDGLYQFNNWMILTIDHVHPHARGGSRRMDNLVTCCQPCNLIKGKRPFKTFEDAKQFVLKKRHDWEQMYEQQVRAHQHSTASSH